MKAVACAVIASVAGVSAFAPAFMGAKVAAPRAASNAVLSMSADLLGADVETKGVWDPLGFAKDEGALYRRRVVELKHGRICMLATFGYLLAEVWHPLYDGKIPGGLGAISQVPTAGWLQIIAAIGVVELTVGKQDPSRAPGDLGFGASFNPFKGDSGKYEELQLKELKNGRLAMVGFMGMAVQEGLTGQTPFEQLAAGHTSPFGDGQGLF